MLRKDTRDEVLHAHHVDPSRLGIFDNGNLNGTNSDNTRTAYKYGTIAPIKAEIEDLINLIGDELECPSWRFSITEVAPVDYTKDLVLAEFMFQRGALTPRQIIDNFGGKFGVTVPENDDLMDEYYINNVPVKQIWSDIEEAEEVDTGILKELEEKLWGKVDDQPKEAEEDSEPVDLTD